VTQMAGRHAEDGLAVGRSAIAWSSLVIPVAALLGMLVSAYLTWVHWGGSTALCTGVGDCETVNSSEYAVVSGIPVALLGFGMYVVLFALSIYRPRAASVHRSSLALAVFGISFMGVLYSAYLTYLELAVINAICPWCVTSAVLITLIFAMSVREVLQLSSGAH
jgi:uncharacterized membrane protein